MSLAGAQWVAEPRALVRATPETPGASPPSAMIAAARAVRSADTADRPTALQSIRGQPVMRALTPAQAAVDAGVGAGHDVAAALGRGSAVLPAGRDDLQRLQARGDEDAEPSISLILADTDVSRASPRQRLRPTKGATPARPRTPLRRPEPSGHASRNSR